MHTGVKLIPRIKGKGRIYYSQKNKGGGIIRTREENKESVTSTWSRPQVT